MYYMYIFLFIYFFDLIKIIKRKTIDERTGQSLKNIKKGIFIALLQYVL